MYLDYIIIAVYLLALLYVGVISGSGIKSLSDYAISKRSFSTGALILTFLATSFGAGSMVGDISKVMQDGVIFAIAMSGFLIFALYMSIFIAPYFNERLSGLMTASDVVKKFYGEKAEKISAILALVGCALTTSSQINALGSILSGFLTIDYSVIVIAIGMIVIFYSAIGGIRSVIRTDMIQFWLVLIAMPIMAFWVISKAGGMSNIFIDIDPNKVSLFSHPKASEYSMLFMAGILPFLWMHPPLWHRYLIANAKQIGKIYQTEIVVRSIFLILVSIIAFASLKVFPNINPKLVMPALIEHVLPIGFRGLTMVAILAVSMSTIDSYLNTSAILVARNFASKFIDKDSVLVSVARVTTIILGLAAIFLAIQKLKIVEVIILSFGIWGAGVNVPLVGALLSKKVYKHSFYVCLLMTLVTFLFSYFYIKELNFYVPTIAVFTSFLSFLVSQFIGNVYSIK